MKNKKIWSSWLFLSLSLLLTFYLALNIKSNLDKIAETEFKFHSNEISHKIVERLHAHAQFLRSSAAYFSVSDTVTRKHWKDFVENSKIDLNLPGIQGIGFSLIIPENKLQQHLQRIRGEGFPDYRILPEGQRDIYTSIIYLEPFSERNHRAFGYDMMTEPVRREAMEHARDMNIAALSGKVLLVQETGTDVQAGNLMYVPVYRNGSATKTLEERRSAIIGWVYSPHRMNDLMLGIMNEWDLQANKKIYLHIFDGAENSPQSILFESHKPKEQLASENIRFSSQILIKFNGHQWLLVFNQQTGNFIIDYMSVWALLFSGLTMSFLLFFFTKSLANTNYKARSMAKELTIDLKENEIALKESQEIANLGTYSLDITTGIWKSSEILDEILGINKSYERSIESWNVLIHPDFKEPMLDYFKNTLIGKRKRFNKEYKIIKNNNGEERWVHGLGKLEFDRKNNPIRMIGTISDITDQKRYEEKLHLNREQYKSLFDNSPLGIYQTNPNGDIIRANPALLKMLEYDSLSELQKRNLNKEGYSNQSSVSRQHFIEMIERDGFIKGLEESWETKTGKVLPIRENARVIRGKNEETLYYEGTVEDITERKIFENKLLESEKALKEAQIIGKYAYWDYNFETNRTNWSENMYRLFGYEPFETEPTYETYLKHIHPDDLHLIDEGMKSVINEKQALKIELRYIQKNGNIIWIENIVNGEFVNNNLIRLFGTNQDITERKLVEKELQESEQRLRTIVETAPVPLIISKISDGTILLANESVGKLFNISARDAIEKKTPNFYYNSNDRDTLLKSFSKNGFVDNYEIILKKSDGSPVYCSVSLKLMILDNEQVIITGIHDITERKRTENEIKSLAKFPAENRNPVLRLARDGVILYANEASQGILNDWKCMIGSQVPIFWRNLVTEILDNQSERSIEIEMIDRIFQFKVAPIAEGGYVNLYATDITEQKKAEKEILNISSRLQLATSTAKIGIWDLDAVNNKLFWDDAMYSLYGISADVFSGAYEAWEKGLHPEDLLRAREENQMALSGEKEFDTEFRVVWPDKSIHHIKATGFATRDASGNPIRLLGTNRDITESKRAEKEIKDLNETLEKRVTQRTSEILQIKNRLEYLLTSAPVVIYTSSAEPPFGATYIGKNIKQMMGYESEQFLEDPSFWASKIHPDDVTRVFNELPHLFEAGNHTHEYRFLQNDGTYRWMHDEILLIKDKNGKPIEMLGYWIDITDRKNVEETLMLSEARFRDVALSTSDFVWEVDTQGYYTYCSEKIFDVLGCTNDEIIGKTLFDLMPTEEAERTEAIFREVSQSKKPIVDLENLNIKKDGSLVMLLTNGVPVLDKEGNLLGYRGVDKDITHQKQAEEEYHTIIQTAVDGFWIIDQSGKIIDVNKSYCEMSGYSRDELLTKNISDIEEIEKPEEVAERIKAITETGSARFVAMHKRKDRTLMDVQVSTQFSKARGGVFITFIQDITERKASEKRIQETLKEISDYKYAMDETSIVAITDQKGIITYVNDNFCEISEYTRDELIGRDHHIINSEFHPKAFFQELWRTIAAGKIWRGNIKNKAKGGSFYWVQTVIVPFLNKKGKPYQYLTVRRDITEEKQQDEELLKSKEAADAANLAKSEFLANMSHEIRTPMNAIIGFSELLYNVVEGDKQRSQIASIHNSGKNLLGIINDILDLSKIEAGKLSLQKESVNIHKLVKDMEIIFTQKTEEKGISFYIETESQIPSALLLDETRLRQILFNLLGNAIKFTENGHVILTLDKKNKEDNKIDLIVKVEDTGMGIPKSQQNRIFEAFSQQKGQINSVFGGTGLGLTITKRLVEMMGGKISVSSNPGKGSIFTVYLPDVEAGVSENITKDLITFNPKSVLFEKAKVLVVDDNKENRNLIIDLLENSPLTLFEARNGKEAVEIATLNLPDLILMDLTMPVMNGYEACHILKNQENTKSIPMISISASSKIISKTDELKDTFNDSLMKPIDMTELVEVLKKYLKHQTLEDKVLISKKTPKKIKFEINAEQQKNLPELIRILENEFMPDYHKAVKNQMIDQIEKFGKDLVVFAKKNNVAVIIDYGNEISRLADNFEIDKLVVALNRFPQLMLQLKSLINTN